MTMLKNWKGIVAGIALGVLAMLALGPFSFGGANEQSNVGYVAWEFVVQTYAGDQIQFVMNVRDQLQHQFDQQSAGLSDEERLQLFQQFEEELQQIEEEYGIDQLFSYIDRAVALAASDAGVSVVVDSSVIHHGGVDLTPGVLGHLGVEIR